MKTKAKLFALFAAAALAMSVTACGKDEESATEPTEPTLPIEVSETVVGSATTISSSTETITETTTSSETTTKPTTTTPAMTTSSKASMTTGTTKQAAYTTKKQSSGGSSSGGGNSSGGNAQKPATAPAQTAPPVQTTQPVTTTTTRGVESRKLVPDAEINLSDDIPLTKFVIGGDKEFDLRTCTITELREEAVIGKRGVAARYTHDKEDYYFFGEAFSPSPSAAKFNIEFLENGLLVTNYSIKNDPYYEIKGITFEKTSKGSTYVVFADDIKVGNYKDVIEEQLGVGADVEVSDDEIWTYYKNKYATMIIEYDVSSKGAVAKRITVVLND